ncbi:MAG: hypothetical protein ABFR19_02285 [Pseudomonadota bacterium]
MTLLLCKLWPYLAGGLIGWLLAGWFARRLQYGEPPVEKIVEKKVEVNKITDNPEHLSRISLLEAENAGIGDLKARIASLEEAGPEVIEKVVEVETLVDNPEHLSQISRLEAENARIGDLKARIATLEQAGPEVVEKVLEVEKLVDNPEHLARIKELEQQLEGVGQGAEETAVFDAGRARAAGFRVRRKEGRDDFTVIEGIGPKINDLIHNGGIHSYSELAVAGAAAIQNILDAAGPNYRFARPATWPTQAELAAGNQWEALKAWQDELDGGVKKS